LILSNQPKNGANNLAALPTFDPGTGEILAIVETPKSSRNKYSYDPKVGAFRLGGVLSEGMSFPYDFGFIPSTLGDDGDPLNVLILLDAPVLMGCLVTVRLLGVIETEQQERDGERNRNDRLIAAATHAHTHEPIRSLEDLPSYLLTEVEGFFAQYNQLRGKHFDPIGRGDMERALILIEDGRKAFEASSAQ
jgi:inorganic pyrophosphatase